MAQRGKVCSESTRHTARDATPVLPTPVVLRVEHKAAAVTNLKSGRKDQVLFALLHS